MTKAQQQILVHMYQQRTHLIRKGEGVWHYSHSTISDGVSIRSRTVSAMMREGLITMGFDASSLTEAGLKVAAATNL
jgi:hypothetical protein